jgi:hypothetical protein
MRISPLAWTCVPSTSRSDRTGRQYPQTFVADVYRRVLVAVVARAARGARPDPDIERHLVADCAARGTRLGARIPAVALDERLAGARGLVFQKSRQHAPAHVGHRLRERVVLQHPLHIQVLDRDHLVLAHDAMADLVQVVPSGAAHALMRARHQPPGAIPACRSFLLSRQLALLALEVLLRFSQVARVVEFRSVAGDGEMREADINADCLAFRGYGGHHLSVVGQDRRMELAAGIAADGHRLELADDVAMHDARDPADFRQVDAAAIYFDALRILDRLAAVLGLEARILAAPCEEILERPREVLQRLLQGLAVAFAKPVVFLLQFRQANAHGPVVQPLAGRPVQLTAQREGIVPHPAGLPELNRQGMRLRISRIQANAGSAEHGLSIACVCLTSKRRFATRGLYPGPERPGFTPHEGKRSRHPRFD